MLTVLMATYNGARTLTKVLQAYCRLTPPAAGWRLVIVDNGSDDDSAVLIGQFRQRLPLTCLHEGRRGKNVALNTALAWAMENGDHAAREEEAAHALFVFADDDAVPEPDWLCQLDACARARPDYAVFGGTIVADWASAPPPWLIELVPLGLTFGVTASDLADGPVFPGLVWGANMALRRAVFAAGHRFDESVGPRGKRYAMGSETMLTRRLHQAGYLSWFCPAARVAHLIRPHQMTIRSVLRRAYNCGRGKCRQDLAYPPPWPEPATLWRVPRWMLRSLLGEAVGALRALVARAPGPLLLRRWEIAYLRGYCHQAWLSRRQRAPKVLITSYSGELGGMELRMGQEARLLAASGCRSELALRPFPGFEQWAATLRREHVAVSVFDPPLFFEQWRWRRLNLWRARWFAARTLRSYRPSLVHVAFCWTSYGASALWLAHHCRLPAVVTVHNAFPPAQFSSWHRPLLAQAFASVRGVYAVSESAMRHFLLTFEEFIVPGTRLAVIPNGVDTARFQAGPRQRRAARRRLGLPPGALVLGSVGRLSVQKRPHALLALFCAVRQGFPDLYLVLAGSGPLEAALRAEVARLGLAKQVIFTGYCEAVEHIMPAFDLHLLLSSNEGFGIATIEAMACGVPVVGTDVPGTADILRDSAGGVLVPLDDAAAAARTVAALLADPARRRAMARAAREEAESRHAQSLCEQRVLAFYRGLV
ncbi:MAG: glycosyltransferase [Pseudomonadota bacterium]